MDLVMLQLMEEKLLRLNKTFQYPIFFQLWFRADWLVSQPKSSQKRLAEQAVPAGGKIEKRWKQNSQIPTFPVLHTPINSIDVMRQKRLTVVLQIFEAAKSKPENFAYANIMMSELKLQP